MMKEFIKKYRNNHKYKTQVNLILSIIFVIIVTIYATSLDTSNINNNTIDEIPINSNESNMIKFKSNVHYTVNININAETYKYEILEKDNEIEINKKINDIETSYIFKKDSYYKKNDTDYVITTKEDVFEEINPDYINLKNINQYLMKSKKQNNQYLVYLKDIILGIDSNEYFVIIKNNNKISIDYLPLIKYFNREIDKYSVDINIINGI